MVKTQGNGAMELETFEHCAFQASGVWRLLDEHLQAMTFDDNGLAAIRIGARHFLVNRSGRTLPVVTYDNWADDFSEGLVRSPLAGKLAYFDHEFRLVIAPKYDWGWPFREGRALVCKGCSPQAADADGHRAVTGGQWGYIDRNGNEIVPVIHARQALPEPPGS